MKKVFFVMLAVVSGYIFFLKVSERIGTQAIWQKATDAIDFSE